MKRIICHWTAGTHKTNDIDKKHYHFIYEGDGQIVSGIHPIEANAEKNAPLKSGKYAAHTAKCNTGSIGLSMACMAGAQEGKTNGQYPMTRIQFMIMCKDAAMFCRKYNIPVTNKTVLSHAEVQANLGIKQAGKWDFTVLPFEPQLKGAKACGDFMRDCVRQYLLPPESIQHPATHSPTPKTAQPEKKTLWQWLCSLFGA